MPKNSTTEPDTDPAVPGPDELPEQPVDPEQPAETPETVEVEGLAQPVVEDYPDYLKRTGYDPTQVETPAVEDYPAYLERTGAGK